MANYNDLRAATLGSTQEEEAVTVNTRALIDKVLARYSSENTTLRELIQNAADASATSVEIRFETVPGSAPEPVRMPETQSETLQRVIKSKVARMIVRNNGMAFREEDWQRLKRIAEGNPDETKIGAFGVGFYSVFADTDEPFISSGDQTMAFYWKGNSLFTRRAKMPQSDPFTTFLLDYREPGDLPDLKVLCQFFATSLTFVRLNEISLFIDDRRYCHVKKKESPAMDLEIPRSIIKTTREGLMTVQSIETSRVQIDAEYLNITHYKPAADGAGSFVRSFFSKITAPTINNQNSITSSNLHENTTASIFLRIATATVTTKVTQRFAQELERATKKPPPKKTYLACLTMSKDEQDASEHESEIFRNVIPSRAGKIFIGFPTHQTTSFKAHISAHSVIPTVERENIDLNARIIKTWNIEMLRAAGILGRIMYMDEMTTLGRRAEGLKLADLKGLYEDAMHIMKQFTFDQSTPSAQVGEHIAESFWSCTKYTVIELLSTKGVLPSNKIRLAGDVEFLDGLPLLPTELARAAPDFVDFLKRGGYLTDISITDIKHELSLKPLTAVKAVQFLKWLAKKVDGGEMDEFQMKMLLDDVIVLVPTDVEKPEAGTPFALAGVRFFASTTATAQPRFTADLPLPPTCLPHTISKELAARELAALGWDELDIPEWLSFITANRNKLPVEQNISTSPQFANKVLALISKDWEKLGPGPKNIVIAKLKDIPCLPTKQGMKMPKESYLPSVKLFNDLPIIHGLQGVREKFLAALGVRKTVELELVFKRLLHDGVDGEKWSHVDLLKYLVSIKEDIPGEDIKKLRNAALWKAEPANSTTLYRANQLYVPSSAHRSLKLPVFWWPGEWRETGAEYQLMRKLGLQLYPSEDALIQLAAGSDTTLRTAALGYLIRHFVENGYDARVIARTNVAFLPVEGQDRLVRPTQCFSSQSAALFGFNLVHRSIREHSIMLGVRPDPPIEDCADQLIKYPPKSSKEAREVFEYLSTRIKEVYTALANKLSGAAIVPVKKQSGLVYLTPRICYIGDTNHQYANIFDFVDFGPAANSFLMHTGSKPEPSPKELGYRLAAEPARLYRLFQSEDKYLALLKKIALEWPTLKKDAHLVESLKQSQCLGAYKEIVSGDAAEGEDNVKEFLLARAVDIFIQDDITAYRVFKGQIQVAPEDEALESLYKNLGALSLVANVKERYKFGTNMNLPQTTEPLKKLIVERSRLFLYNSTDDVRHNADWVEKNVTVSMAESIKLTRILTTSSGGQISSEEVKTAALVKPPGKEQLRLFITHGYQTYDIAVGLVRILLMRPKPHSSLLLDSLMSTDLRTLQARGFNVGRILRAKAAEARLMEQERLKKVEEQQRALEAQEKALAEQQAAAAAAAVATRSPGPKMPGGFEATPEPNRTIQPPPQEEAGGFFSRGLSRFTKMMNERPPSTPRALTPGNPSTPEPPHTPEVDEKKPLKTHIQDTMEKPTAPHRLSANLQRAVNSSRRYDDAGVFTKPQTFEVKESGSFCDTRPGQNISFAATSATGIKIYLTNELSEAERSAFLGSYATQLTTFSHLLLDLAAVFSMESKAMHIFYDHKGGTIAFNLNGSIFCNVRFFLQLHATGSGGVLKGGYNKEAVKYWFVTVCHELAHNIVKDHSANHSFYTESFVVEYFEGVVGLVQGGTVAENEGRIAAEGRLVGGGGEKEKRAGDGVEKGLKEMNLGR